MVTNSRAHTMQASQTAHGNPWLLLSSVIFSSQLQMAVKPSHLHCSYNYCDCRDYNNRNNYNIISSGCNHYKQYKHCEYHPHISGRRSCDSFYFFTTIFFYICYFSYHAVQTLQLHLHIYNTYYNNHFKHYEHCEH